MTRFPPSRKPRKKTSPRARGYIRGVDRARKSRNAAQLHHQGARTTSSRGMEGRREMHYGTVCATFIPSARWNFLSFSERVKRVVLESRRRAESLELFRRGRLGYRWWMNGTWLMFRFFREKISASQRIVSFRNRSSTRLKSLWVLYEFVLYVQLFVRFVDK